MAGRLSSRTFVGRVAELDQLGHVFSELPRAGASTVLVNGEAGIGKSRLIEQFCRHARSAGALVATGTCTPADGGGLPYGPIIGVIRDASRQLDSPDVDRVLGTARRMLGLEGQNRSETTGLAKTALFEALLQSVSELAASSSVVLVVEDLHWADSASVEAIDFLTRNLVDRPALLVASYRTDEIENDRPLRRLISELGRHGRAFDLELAGMSRDETAQLLAGILDGPPDCALVDAVYARSSGNPFFAEELAAARDATSLPRSLRNLVLMRVEQLPDVAREVIALAATNGPAISHELLSAALCLDPDALDAALHEAIQHYALVPHPTEHSLAFRHSLLREAIIDSLLPAKRSRLHKALAAALAAHPHLGASGPGHAAFELADHWWEAGIWPEAFTACARAGREAAALMAMHEAHAYFERALIAAEKAGSSCPAFDRVAILREAADAAFMTGLTERGVELARWAIEALDDAAEPRAIARCYTLLARNAWAAGEADAAADALRRGVAVLSQVGPSAELAAILCEEARILMLSSHYEAAEEKCGNAIDVARMTGARLEESHALITAGCCVASRGDLEAGLALLHCGLAIAEELGDPDQLDRGYNNISHVLMQASRLEEAAALVLTDAGATRDVKSIRFRAAGQNAAEALVRLGRFDDADNLLCHLAERGPGMCAFGPNGVRAMMALRAGRFDDAARYLSLAEQMSARLGTAQVAGELHARRAELKLELGDPAVALTEVERALTISAGAEDGAAIAEMYSLGIRAVVDDFEAARARGRHIDPEKSRRKATDFVHEADELVNALLARDFPCSARLQAFVAQSHAEAGRLGPGGASLWRVAVTKWDAAGEPYPAAYCRWREASALLSTRGDRKRATAAVEEAWRTTLRLGAQALRERIEQLAVHARIALSDEQSECESTRSSVAEDLGLTSREVEVLRLLMKGAPDRQIAEDLFISKKTASVHVSNLLRKLCVANRVEAAEIGQRAGLA